MHGYKKVIIGLAGYFLAAVSVFFSSSSSLDCSVVVVVVVISAGAFISASFFSTGAGVSIVGVASAGKSSYSDTVTVPSSSLTIFTRTFLGGLVLPLDHICRFRSWSSLISLLFMCFSANSRIIFTTLSVRLCCGVIHALPRLIV